VAFSSRSGQERAVVYPWWTTGEESNLTCDVEPVDGGRAVSHTSR
jgi:hypothetical protein